MIIYLSMLAVVAIGYMLHLARESTYGKKNKTSKFAAYAVFGYIIFWVGIRDAFVDTAAYISRFNSASLSGLKELDFTFGSGWGFDVIEILFKTFISSNYHAWLMFLAIITGGCIAVTFRRYSVNYYYTVFLFIATTTFTWMMNGIRQFLVTAIIFACTPLIEKRKWLLFCIITLLCSTIHGSCIIMIPIYFIAQAKPWRWQTIAVIAAVLLVFMFTTEFTNILDSVLSDTSYALDETFSNDDGVNPLRVLVFSVSTFMAFACRKKIDENNSIVNIFVNMSILTSGLYLIGMVTNGIMMGRMPIYTLMYEFLLLPRIIDNSFTGNSRKLIYIISIGCFCVYFYLMSRGLYYSSEITGRIF